MIMSYSKKFPWGNQTDFKNKILDGRKIHTLREDSHGRWIKGMHIHHAHGAHTKSYDCFLENNCTSVQKIQIRYEKGHITYISVLIDGEFFYSNQDGLITVDNNMQKLAKNDGFGSVEDFFKWFDHDFHGKIIHWSDFKY